MSQMKKADLAIVKALPGNDTCAECPMKHPQWASVSFGTLFCLECSGIHRSLGVHISFVRSIAMDSWSESQLEIMKNGGNDKCNAYLKANGVSPTKYTTNEAVNGGIKKKYDNDVAMLYKLKLKARLEGKPEPTEVPKRKTARNASAGASSAGAPKGSNDPNGMERLAGESDQQYIARQTRIREEAKARMAAKFGRNGTGKMGGVGSSPHPSQQSGIGGFNLDSLSTGLASVSSTAATGFGSAWSLARDTVSQTAGSASAGTGGGSNIGSGVSELGSSLWSSFSQVTKEVVSVVNTNDDNTFSELNQKMRSQRKGSSSYSGFGSQDLMAKGNTTNQTTTPSSKMTSDVDMNSISALPGESDKDYMERQLRIQKEAKARMASKFGSNPNLAMKKMSVTAAPKPAAKPKVPASDDFFASFGT